MLFRSPGCRHYHHPSLHGADFSLLRRAAGNERAGGSRGASPLRTPSPAPSAATDDTISVPETEFNSATEADTAARNVCALHFAGRDYNSQPIIDVLVVSSNAVTLERALVDNSAQASLLDRSVAEAHGMAITPKWSTVGTIHEIPPYRTGEVDFFVRSVDGRETFDLRRIELLPHIPIARPPVDWDEMKRR